MVCAAGDPAGTQGHRVSLGDARAWRAEGPVQGAAALPATGASHLLPPVPPACCVSPARCQKYAPRLSCDRDGVTVLAGGASRHSSLSRVATREVLTERHRPRDGPWHRVLGSVQHPKIAGGLSVTARRALDLTPEEWQA